MLVGNNISLQIGDVPILTDVNVELRAGEVTVVVGPNGAGKTSLLNVLIGTTKPTQGNVLFGNQPIGDWAALERAQRLAVLPQTSTLNFPFLVEEVVMLGRTPHSTGLARDEEVVQEALAMVDAGYLFGRTYTQLSGGEKQRVQLARVLAQIWDSEENQARALVLDEPTASLDLEHQQMVMKLVRQLAERNIMVLMVLHDLNLAINCADQIVMLQCGHIAAAGKPMDVIDRDTVQQIFNVDVDIMPSPQGGLPLIIPK